MGCIRQEQRKKNMITETQNPNLPIPMFGRVIARKVPEERLLKELAGEDGIAIPVQNPKASLDVLEVIAVPECPGHIEGLFLINTLGEPILASNYEILSTPIHIGDIIYVSKVDTYFLPPLEGMDVNEDLYIVPIRQIMAVWPQCSTDG
jgi:hypothetical protein